MNFLRALTLGIRRGRISTSADLCRAVSEGAAYLAQGTSYSYIRARAGTMGPRLMQDPGFAAALDRCKWEGYAACAQDLLLIAEAELRPRLATPSAFWTDQFGRVLAAHPVPEHLRAVGWAEHVREFEARLEHHLAAPPRGVAEVASHSGHVIMDFAPVEPAIRDSDRQMVVNNTCLRFIEHVDALRRRVEWPELAADIAGQLSPAPTWPPP